MLFVYFGIGLGKFEDGLAILCVVLEGILDFLREKFELNFVFWKKIVKLVVLFHFLFVFFRRR